MESVNQLVHLTCRATPFHSSSPRHHGGACMFSIGCGSTSNLCKALGQKTVGSGIPRAGRNNGIVVTANADVDGVSLGTMKLPANTDIARFESLLFQWANSLSQGANLPLPVPLKVDRVEGGARLGFTEVDDGKAEVPVYIDCLICPATDSSGLLFRAIRNGPLKDQPPPGEPRIMRSLLQALQRSVEIARI